MVLFNLQIFAKINYQVRAVLKTFGSLLSFFDYKAPPFFLFLAVSSAFLLMPSIFSLFLYHLEFSFIVTRYHHYLILILTFFILQSIIIILIHFIFKLLLIILLILTYFIIIKLSYPIHSFLSSITLPFLFIILIIFLCLLLPVTSISRCLYLFIPFFSH